MKSPLLLLLLGLLLAGLTGPARVGAQASAAPKVEIFSTRRVSAGKVHGDGHWIASITDETVRDLNRDGDQDDLLLCLTDLRQIKTIDTLIAVDPATTDADDDWPVAIDGDTVAVIVSEYDTGNQDLNKNGFKGDSLLGVYSPVTQKLTLTPHPASRPRVKGTDIYFLQNEEDVKQDLNADKDLRDAVVCLYRSRTGEFRSLGMEAGSGFELAGDYLVTRTSEVSQGSRDLNGDGDVQDLVAQVHSLTRGDWTSSGLDCSFDLSLTPQLLAVGVTEQRQGGKDLNTDGDANDIVCHIRDLASGMTQNTQRDCSGGVSAAGNLVGFLCVETNQGKTDLNGNGMPVDEVAMALRQGSTTPVNIAWDGSGGLVASGGKIAFGSSELAQKRDLNKDGDQDDLVVALYDPVRHVVSNTALAMEGPLVAEGDLLAFRVPEIEQGNTDLNRDRDSDDSVLFLIDVPSGTPIFTAHASTENFHVTRQGVGFAMLEADQGDRDVNGDGDMDDELVQVARLRPR